MRRRFHLTHYDAEMKDLATSRAHTMKRSTIGLNVRFLRVMIVTGQARRGKSTLKAFNEKRSPYNRRTDFGNTVMKRPVTTRFARR